LCDGFQTLGIGSLNGCTSLQAIELPADIWAMEGHNFGFTALTDVYYAGTLADWEAVQADGDRYFSDYNNEPLYEATWHYNSSLPDNYCTDGHVLDRTTFQVITGSTATEYGVVQRVCSVCGATKTETVFETRHDWDSGEVTKAATCTEDGVKTYRCTFCKGTKTETIDRLGHDDYTVIVTAPTCVAKGYTTCTCSRCGDSFVSAYTDARGHSYGDWTVTQEATANSAGQRERVCSICGEKQVETVANLGNYVATLLQSETTVTIAMDEAIPADEYVMVAVYDENHRFLGIERVKGTGGTVDLSSSAGQLALFWLDSSFAPKCEQVTQNLN
jgi:hypothetical protein